MIVAMTVIVKLAMYYDISNNTWIVLMTMMMRSIFVAAVVVLQVLLGLTENGRTDDCNDTNATSHSKDHGHDNRS